MSAPSAEHGLIYWVTGIISMLFGFVSGKLWLDQTEMHKQLAQAATKSDLAELRRGVREDIKLEFDMLHATITGLEMACPLRKILPEEPAVEEVKEDASSQR